MKGHYTNTGRELISLLRQQRDFYRQLKELVCKQHRLAGENSSELVLEILSRRRELVHELIELNDRLRPMKAKWKKLSRKIEPEYKTEAQRIALETEELVADIRIFSISDAYEKLGQQADRTFEKIVSGTDLQ